MNLYRILTVAVILLLIAVDCQANFLIGDFVPTSRKSQIHGLRSQWHDVLGAHCPKFGLSRMAVVPIPQPIGHEPFTLAQITKNYKMQLSFDGDRVATHWFQLMGKGAPEVPYLLVSLVRSGDALVSASAEVVALPPSDVHYERVRAEFSDHNLWPKHLPVYYHWEARHDVDVGRGLMVLFAAGAAAMLLAVLSVVRSYKRQLQQFLDDVTGETPLRAVGGFSGSMVKAD